jgi:thioredoxin 1
LKFKRSPLEHIIKSLYSHKKNNNMNIKEINNLTEFEEYLQTETGTVVVEFYATWCGPCKIMAPIFEATSELPNLEKAKFIKINRDENIELIEKYGFEIPSIPRFFTTKIENGKVEILEEMGGTQSKTSLTEKISKYI